MKKKAVVGLILAVVFTITACGGKKAPVNQQAQAQPVPAQPAQPAQSAPDRPSDEELQEMLEIAQEVEAEASEYEQQQPTAAEQQQPVRRPEEYYYEDPMWEYRIIPEEINPTLTELCVKKGDVFYRAVGDANRAAVYHTEENISGEHVICSFGATVLSVDASEGDEIVCFSDSSLPDLQLNLMEMRGSTITVFDNAFGVGMFDYRNPEEAFVGGASTKLRVEDMNGVEVPDYTDLVGDEFYKASFTTGTQVREYTLRANVSVFHFASGEERYENRLEADFKIPGTPTTEGYATYDISSLPHGFYEVGWGIILIQ